MGALTEAVFCTAADLRRMPATLQDVLAEVGGHAARLTLTTEDECRSWSAGVSAHYDVTCQARVDTVHAALSLAWASTRAAQNLEIQAVGDELAWLFAKAFHGETTVRAIEARTSELSLVLERVTVPLLVLDGAARIRHVNAAAQALLRGADGVREVQGALVVDDRSSQRAFTEAVRRSARGLDVEPQVQILRRTQGSPLGAILVPYAGAPSRDRVLVAIHDSDVMEAIDASWLQRLCDLTSTERALAEALVRGTTVQEFAADRACSEHTARSHLKSILAKTSAHRQPEVVRMLAVGPGRWA